MLKNGNEIYEDLIVDLSQLFSVIKVEEVNKEINNPLKKSSNFSS
jgi:hypothetical protein